MIPAPFRCVPAESMIALPPCVLHEDDHLLVVNKPAGWNTHSPSAYAGEGIYDWLRHRERRWASLAIIHRLDKDTSGVMVFAKTPLANRELTAQFTRHEVRKRYRLITDRVPPAGELRAAAAIRRAGERYVASSAEAGGEPATTTFVPLTAPAIAGLGLHALIAEPHTGRTHQIRVHAAASGFPVLGDVLYGGSPAARLFLHAESMSIRHPVSGDVVTFSVSPAFDTDVRQALRAAFIDPAATDAYRMIHGNADGWPGCRVDRLGEYLLYQSEADLADDHRQSLAAFPSRGTYHKRLSRQVRQLAASEASPQLVSGEAAGKCFTVRENGVRFELGFGEGYSVGLFLDQRDNRRRFLSRHVAAGFELFPPEPAMPTVLNAFAYTCGFSVCAALAGARVTSLDLSKRYLEWGRRNFALNDLDPAAQEFIYGDAFDWFRRLVKKGRHFDVVVLDPPTFSQSKEQGTFQAERDYGRLVAAALPLLAAGGVLLASTNAARLAPERFLDDLRMAVQASGRAIRQEHYAPQPPDFPVSRDEPAYLKTVWLRIR
jgi:23S rRNA (cytosine1962-C5)-methyltransferase